jgi:hypothetical protein
VASVASPAGGPRASLHSHGAFLLHRPTLLDAKDNDITYFYESQLKSESAPVADIHFHPVEPRTLRVAATLKS